MGYKGWEEIKVREIGSDGGTEIATMVFLLVHICRPGKTAKLQRHSQVIQRTTKMNAKIRHNLVSASAGGRVSVLVFSS